MSLLTTVGSVAQWLAGQLMRRHTAVRVCALAQQARTLHALCRLNGGMPAQAQSGGGWRQPRCACVREPLLLYSAESVCFVLRLTLAATQLAALQGGAVEAYAEVTGDELGEVDAFAELVSLAVAKDPRLAAAGAHALAGAASRGAAASAAGKRSCCHTRAAVHRGPAITIGGACKPGHKVGTNTRICS